MNRLHFFIAMAACALPVVSLRAANEAYIPGVPPRADFKSFARPFLEKHCFECHDDVSTKGNLNLLELGAVDEVNAAVWTALWAQIALQEMPPRNRKETKKPQMMERLRMADWIVSELQRAM